MATTSGVMVRIDEGTAYLTLDRPDRRNALSLELMHELLAALDELAADEAVRTVVIGGNGPAFSAGHDLSEMVGRDMATYQELFDVCTRLMLRIHELPQPVIARVHGIATAAGCQLVATCDLAVATPEARFATSGINVGLFCTTPAVALSRDLAIAAEEARFATPGVRIGLFCSTPMVPLSRAIGRKRALQMLLTGEPIDAATALDWGLVNRVVPAERLDDAVRELAEAIGRASPLTVGIGKRAFYDQVDLDERGAYDLTKTVMSMNAMADDAQEGIGAFLEKRSAVWTNS